MHAMRGSNNFLSSKIHQEMSTQALGLFILLFLVVKAIWEGLKKWFKPITASEGVIN